MNTFMLLYGAFVALSKLQSLNVTVDPEAWNSFKLEHGKVYANEREELMRRSIFGWNKFNIDKFNAEKSDQLGYSMEVNHLADLSDEEFSSYMTRHIERSKLEIIEQIPVVELGEYDDFDVPDEIDWRKFDARVGAVRNQGKCSSGWAFAGVAALEGQEVVLNESMKSIVELSVQNMLDCGDNMGCTGNEYSAKVYDQTADNGGIEADQSYPYEAQKSSCRFHKEKSVLSLLGSHKASRGESILKRIVGKFGPIAINIDAEPDLRFYSKGIYESDTCSSSIFNLNHGILIIGYGSEGEGKDYWIVKNSFGSDWGEEGFFRLARNKSNMCGVGRITIVPVFTD